MVLKTLFALASSAFAATNLAPSPVVHTNIIQLSHECTTTPEKCAPGLVCAGHPWKKTCVTPKHPGMQCRIEPFWVCRSELLCENDVCKIPAGGDCARTPDQCVAGSECAGSGTKRTCAPIPAKLGEKCDKKSMKCAVSLTCDKNMCKLPRGKICTNTPEQCASGFACDGKRTVKRCITYKEAGMRCPALEDFWICASGLTCEKNVCKIPAGKSCASSPRNCVTGTKCVGSGRARKCAVPPSVAGEKCNSSSMKCARSLSCQKGVCKISVGNACSSSPKNCVSGAKCIGSGRARKCVGSTSGPGKRCNSSTKKCARGLTCQKSLCNIPVGGSCTASPKTCVSGSKCVGTRRSRKCVVQKAKAGETCDRNVKCGRGLTCDGVCKLGKNARCERTPKLCSRGLSCVGTRKKKICAPLGGMGARCTETGSVPCKGGLVCHKRRCTRGTVGERKSCKKHACKMGLVCAGRPNRMICMKPMKKGEKCKGDPYWKCAVGLQCKGNYCVDI